MISFKLAKELKDAGLIWYRGEIDIYYWRGNIMSVWNSTEPEDKEDVWAPRLDQLLEHIEWRGYTWEVGVCYRCNSLKSLQKQYYCKLVYIFDNVCYKQYFYGNTPEDAVAKALLWILQQEKEK